jgi:lipoate-protein ligase A
MVAYNCHMLIGTFTESEIANLTAAWRAVPWRLIPERPLSSPLNVALDEVLTDRIGRGDAAPTLRFWRWSSPAVVIGRCQSVANEVDPDGARALGMTVVRRITGGGGMFIQPHGAITYSLILPEKLVEGLTLRQSYEVCDAWAVGGLRGFGIECFYRPINDIACAAGKIGGAAQARRRGVVLHHTTLAYALDPAEMHRVLRIGRAKLKERGVPSAAKEVAPLNLQTALSREAIAAGLLEAFRVRHGGAFGELNAEELTEAEALVEAKYGNDAWTGEFE